MVAMTRLFNGILETGHFPGSWKIGHIITIPKASKEPPIRVKSTPDHAAVPHRQAVRAYHAATPVLPPDTKTGAVWFRSRHSTTLQLARVLHYMAAEHNRGRRIVGIFFDTEKAFHKLIMISNSKKINYASN
ncbi:RNA-directed DNA polymerase from mobile element jockey [Eumeta japonica]|uniref:RNA-directed DNA polymerase from mobile element jockey n=1 Tax=Eumeta variegata TaxID=151549 RepID=A0A4C1T6E3_EUMVA|nr:RNA-directed DNA polymerase from mobile element jockey [Eumeta japonica]